METGSMLLRNLVYSIFVYADNSLLTFTEKHRLLELIRSFLIAFVLFLLRLIPSLTPNYFSFHSLKHTKDGGAFAHSPPSLDGAVDGGEKSVIGRALSQLLSIMSEIPVSSRKYEVVRSLAEKIIEDNRREVSPALREVNRTVLSAAFSRTLGQLELDMVEKGVVGPEVSAESGNGPGPVDYPLYKVLRVVRSVGDLAWTKVGGGRAREGGSRSGRSAEKLAAELVWLTEKMVACGFPEEAVRRWASASRLAWLAISAEPRLQCSLVKLSGTPPLIVFSFEVHGTNVLVQREQKHERKGRVRVRERAAETDEDSNAAIMAATALQGKQWHRGSRVELERESRGGESVGGDDREVG
uniref:Uncharacterized protein n=1 Tax=Cannabis sativa TaxID=3483 RepID=A0A803Q938_CANSA